MPIANLQAYRDALGEGREILAINQSSAAVVAGRAYDTWRAAVPRPPVPTAPEAPGRDTLGSLGQRNPGDLKLAIVGARFNGFSPGNYIIADRLSHQGGLSGVLDTVQETNLPTAALTRYTDGKGVRIGLSIYTALGTVATTAVVTYTNEKGVSGRVSPAVQIGDIVFREANRMIQIPLQQGDEGVRSVESVQLGASTTAAGNFGVTLYVPLYVVIVESTSGVVVSGLLSGNAFGGVPDIQNNACLFAMLISGGLNGSGSGALITAEH